MYFQANFAPESEAAGTKFNTRTGRPDWAVQSSITPVKAIRPPPPELKPSAQTLGNTRGTRDPPGIYMWYFVIFECQHQNALSPHISPSILQGLSWEN